MALPVDDLVAWHNTATVVASVWPVGVTRATIPVYGKSAAELENAWLPTFEDPPSLTV